MKKATLFMALLTLLFSACTKSNDDDDVFSPNFRVDGITDINIFRNSTNSLSLSVVYMNSQQERVRLSLEGLPSGMTAEFTTTSGLPSFSSYLQITNNSVPAGVYPVRLVATGDITGRHTFTFNITAMDCYQALLKSYTANAFCNSPGSYTETATAVSGQTDRVMFNNFENSGADIYAIVDCNGGGGGTSGSLTIPAQTVGGVTFSGSGNYWSNFGGNTSISITYTRTTGTTTRTCSMSMQN